MKIVITGPTQSIQYDFIWFDDNCVTDVVTMDYSCISKNEAYFSVIIDIIIIIMDDNSQTGIKSENQEVTT